MSPQMRVTFVLVVLGLLATAVQASSCLYAYDYNGNFIEFDLTTTTTNSTGKTVATGSFPHAFAFAVAFSPVHGLGTVSGGRSNDYRSFTTMSLTNGSVVYSPTRVSISGPYGVAADLRPDQPYRLYGMEFLTPPGKTPFYRPAEFSPQTGEVISYFVPEDFKPNGGDPSCSFNSLARFGVKFSLPTSSYITSWTCANVSTLVSINVDTHAVSETVVKLPEGSFFYNLVTHPITGQSFISNRAGNVVYAIEADGSLSTIISVPNSGNVILDLVPTMDSICIPRPQDTRYGRNHPQGTDLVCAKVTEPGTELYNIPFVDSDEVVYLSGATPAPACLSTF